MNKITDIIDSCRADDYALGFYFQESDNTSLKRIPGKSANYNGLKADIEIDMSDDILFYNITINSESNISFIRMGLCLGIDCYMSTFPEWDNKYFPTALRCERDGFWGCFMSPTGEMLGIASPSDIVNYKIEYNQQNNADAVGHRIYTASIEFMNNIKSPSRHKPSPKLFKANTTYEYKVYLKLVRNMSELYKFVKDYANITIVMPEKMTLEAGEPINYNSPTSKLTITDSFGKSYNSLNQLPHGRYTLTAPQMAETRLFVRKDWHYYLDCARRSAEVCQQKIGTHTESWYGYFSRIAYAKRIKDNEYSAKLTQEFDEFFKSTTRRIRHTMLKPKALPHRLQNCSGMASLLVDMYELTDNIKYLEYAEDMAWWLMKLQANDGSYRSHGTHYTCVIYPAKSMLELSIAEKNAGRDDKCELYFNSAYRAIDELRLMRDNIGTEGEMTFEDGMISCSALQLGYLALLLDEDTRAPFVEVAELLINKHKCLEQHLIPDARTKGATLRFWEARYDINMPANMMNSPHGWTSWKTYATYYLYMLTGKVEYLKDTMDTLGACMQMIDENGTLRWAFVTDPCVETKEMVKADIPPYITFKPRVVSEEYLPMVSDWYRQRPRKLIKQYLMNFKNINVNRSDYGGSCDNDVHEHFKCLDECVYGKAFIHELNDGKYLCYNCIMDKANVSISDKTVTACIVYSETLSRLNINAKEYNLNQGLNTINLC